MSDLKYTVEVTGLKDVEQLEKNLDRLHNTLNAGRGSGKSLEEMRKILVGMRGQSSVIADLRDSVKSLNTAAENLAKGFESGFNRLDRTLKQGFQLALDRMNMFGAEVRKDLSSGVKGAFDAGAQAAAGGGKRLSESLQKSVESAGKAASASIAKSSSQLESDVEGAAARARKAATKVYDSLVGGDGALKLSKAVAEQVEELRVAGATISKYHATTLEHIRKAAETAAKRAKDSIQEPGIRSLLRLPDPAETAKQFSELKQDIISRYENTQKEIAAATKLAKDSIQEPGIRRLLRLPDPAETAKQFSELKQDIISRYENTQKEIAAATKLSKDSIQEPGIRSLLRLPDPAETAKQFSELKQDIISRYENTQKEIAAATKLSKDSIQEPGIRSLLRLPDPAETAKQFSELKQDIISRYENTQKEIAAATKLAKDSIQEPGIRRLLRLPDPAETAKQFSELKQDIISRYENTQKEIAAATKLAKDSIQEPGIRRLLGLPDPAEIQQEFRNLELQIRNHYKQLDELKKQLSKPEGVYTSLGTRELVGSQQQLKEFHKALETQMQSHEQVVDDLRSKALNKQRIADQVFLEAQKGHATKVASLRSQQAKEATAAYSKLVEFDLAKKLTSELAEELSMLKRHGASLSQWHNEIINEYRQYGTLYLQEMDKLTAKKLRKLDAEAAKLGLGVAPGLATTGDPAAMLAYASSVDKARDAQDKLRGSADPLRSSLRALTIDGNDTHSAMRGLASGFNLLWLTWGNLAPLFAGAVISNGFVQTAKTGMEVAHTLAIIENIGGNTKDEVAALNQELLRLGKTGPFGPQEVAEAMKTLSLAGLKATEILSATQSTLNFSIAGTTSIQTAADTLVSVTTAFGMGAQGFERVGDVISKAAAESKTSVESFANAMKTASVIGAQYGVSLEDTATAIATMSQLGIEGTAAGTALRNMYADLSGRSAQVAKVLKAQGIEMRDLTTGGFKPMVQVVAELSDHFDGLTAIGQKNLMQALLSERGAKGLVEMLRLIKVEAKDTSKGFANALEEMRKNIEESYGFTAVNAAKLSQTTKSLFEQMGATLKTSMYEAFTEIEPTLSTIARELKLAFGSEDFKDSLTTLVKGVAEVGRSLVQVGVFATENIAIVAMLAAGYKAFTVAANLSAAAQLARTAATKADTAANAANAASQAAKLTGIAAFARFLPGVGTAITVAAGAWALYDAYQRDSSKSGLEFARNYTSDVVKALNDETSKLKELNRLRREGLTLTEAQARLDALDKKAQYVDPYAQTVNSAIKAELAARAELSKRQQEYANYAAKDNKHRVEEQERVVKRLSQRTQAAKAEELTAINQINKATEDAVAARKEAADLDTIDFENRKKLAQVFGKNTFELGAGGGGADGNSFVDLNRDKELQALKAHYDAELAVANDYYNKSKQLLDGHRSANLISEEEYMVQSLQLSRSHEAEQLQVLEASLTAYTEASERRKAALESQMSGAKGKGKNMLLDQLKRETQEFEIFVTNYEKERAKVAAESYARVGETVLKLQTEVGKLLKSSEDFWDNAAVSSAAQKDADELAKKYKNMNTSILSMDSAMYEFEKAQKSTQSEVKKMNAALEKQLSIQKNLLQIELLSLKAAQASGRLTLDEAIQRATLISQFKEGIAELEGKIADNTEKGLELGAERGWDAFQKMRDKQVEELANSMSEAVVDGLMSGDYKSIGKNIRDILQRELIREPLTAIINGVMNGIVGGISNAIFGGGGGSGGGLLGMASNGMSLYNTYQNAPGYINKVTSFLGLGGGNAGLGLSAATAGGAMWGGTAASTGLGLSAAKAGGAMWGGTAAGTGLGMAAPTAGFWAPGTASVLPGAGAAGAAGSSGLMAGLKTAGIYAAAAVAVAAAFGAFRKTKVVDTGIMGTLGVEGGIHDFVQKRKDGSLLSGPKYSIEDHGVSTFDKPMQDAFSAMRTAAIDMGKILGLATDHLKDFTTVITLDSANSSTGTRGLNLKGLSDAEVQAKVQQALEQANNELAQQLIGSWESVTTRVRTGWLRNKSYKDVTTSVYKPSEFAREGETAIETLTRLAQSLSTVNGTLDLLGLKLYEGSLAGGDLASKLVDLFGGLEAFTSVTSGYYQNFYSEEERFRKAGETVNEALKSIGVQLDVFGGEAAKVKYRELVEKAFAEGNQELAAQLLQMSAAFSEVANAAEQATRTLNDSLVAILNRFSDGASESKDLQAQMLAEDASKIWKSIPVDSLKETILTATASDIEKYLREAWAYMDTTEAKQSLISLGNSLLDFTNSAEGASDSVSGLTDTITRELTAAYNAMQNASSVLEKIQSAMGIVTSNLSREAQLWQALGKADYRTQIEIASELSDLVIKRHQVEQQNAEKLLDFGKSLQAYVNSLKIGNLSTFTPAEKLAEAGKQYTDTLKKAQAGDEDALRAIQGASSSYLDLARQYYASSDDYTRIFESVTNSLESLGVKSQSEAQMQLEVSSGTLNELKKLEAITKQAYSTASADFSVQKNLLQQQIDQMLRTADGIEKVQALLAGLPFEISSQFNTGSVSPPASGAGASSYEALAKKYVSIIGPQGGPSDANYVKQYAASIDQGQLDYELKAALALLSDPGDRQDILDVFKNIAQLRGLTIDGSHANGLSYVPYDGYIAQLHEGERVLTAKENSTYTSNGAARSTEMSIMAAEIRILNAKLDKLTEQNERLMTAQIRATVESSNNNSERVVEGITKATVRAAYATTIEKGYK